MHLRPSVDSAVRELRLEKAQKTFDERASTIAELQSELVNLQVALSAVFFLSQRQKKTPSAQHARQRADAAIPVTKAEVRRLTLMQNEL